MRPPIIVCSDDLLVFATKEDAESYLEPVDVEADAHGYDADGRLLHVVVRGEVKRRGWSIDQRRAHVELIAAEDAPSHGDELRARLLEWFESSGDPAARLAAEPLDHLVLRAVRRAAAASDRDARRARRIATALAVALALAAAVAWWTARAG